MAYLVGNLKQSVSGLLTGTNLDNVTNLYGAFERALRGLAQRVSLPSAAGNSSIVLYSNVFSYPAPAGIFGSSITDLRPQGLNRAPWDYAYKVPGEQFDRTKGWLPNGYMVTFEYVNGVEIMRVSTPNVFPRAELDTMSSLTGWTAAGTASGLALDQTVYYQYPGSLRANLATGTGTFTKSIQQQDLTDYQGVGVAFLALYTPDAADLTSVSLKLGSSNTAYDSVSATTGFISDWTDNEWTLVAFDFAGSTTTGVPDWGAIDYAQVSAVAAGSISNFRIGGLWIALPSPHTVLFDSAAAFMTPAGVVNTTISSVNDSILLSDPAYTIYEYEAAKAVAMQMSGGVYTDQIKGFDQVLLGSGNELGLYARYRADNPSESLRTVGSYYDVRA
jgi:hypothetical protein